MRSFSKTVVILVFLFGVFAVFKSPSDPDFGWHYKYGEYLVEHGQILRENIFSYTFTDYKWANSYWVSQAALYLTHGYLGHLWAGLLFAIPLSLAVILYVHGPSKKNQPSIFLTATASLLLFVEFSGGGIVGRPMYFSSLFLMVLITMLLRYNKIRRLWLLTPLFLIWANTHADFALGLFIFGLFVIDKLLCRSPRTITKEKAALAIIGLLSVAATLINPFGLELWRTLIKESHPYQFTYIIEWTPVTTENIYYFATYCIMLGFVISALISTRHKLPLWYILSLGFFCILAVRSQYFLRIAVILGIYAFLVFWSPHLQDLKNALSVDVLKKFKAGFLAILILSTLVIFGLFCTDAQESLNNEYWATKQGYPQEAVNFALENNINGNVFNYYGWGGYLIWKYPQIKTFVDGRMPSWREDNKSVFEDYIKVVNAPKKNIKILRDYNVHWILYPTKSKFVNFLKEPNSGWEEIYSDDNASIFVETTRFDIISLWQHF